MAILIHAAINVPFQTGIDHVRLVVDGFKNELTIGVSLSRLFGCFRRGLSDTDDLAAMYRDPKATVFFKDFRSVRHQPCKVR